MLAMCHDVEMQYFILYVDLESRHRWNKTSLLSYIHTQQPSSLLHCP